MGKASTEFFLTLDEMGRFVGVLKDRHGEAMVTASNVPGAGFTRELDKQGIR